jgi:proteasome-associated ATPase
MENSSRSVALLKEIINLVPEDNQRLRNYLHALEQSLRDDADEVEKVRQAIEEYEDAYRKLTAPANRTGVLLEILEEGIALVSVGESEFVASVDPHLDLKLLKTGARIKVNEAYAVVGVLPAHTGGQIMKVSEVLPKNRLRVSQDSTGSVGRIVVRGYSIVKANIKKGDEVRVEPNFKVALEHYPQQEDREYFYEEIPETPWSKIGGQEAAIELIRETIETPLLYPDIYKKFDKKPIKGILLYGPPGCGKTLIGKATAYNLAREYSRVLGKEVKEYFMHISGPKILNMWLGETERMVRDIFSIAREHAKEGRLVFVFFDEAESVLRTRSSGKWLNISNTVVPQFCAELDGLVSLENVVIILTSNRPDYIDPAILRPERIDRKVKIGRPSIEASRAIFDIYLHKDIPIDPKTIAAEGGDQEAARSCIADSAVAYLWRSNKETEFLKVAMRNGSTKTLYWHDLISGALIKSIVDRAKDIVIRRAIAEPKKQHGVGLQDLKDAMHAEYRENEIFPKTDALEDWLKLLDFDEENIVSVVPMQKKNQYFNSERVI